MRIQARRLAPGGMTHQSVAAAGVDVERRAPDWTGVPDSREAASAADTPAERRHQAMEGGEASSQARGDPSSKASAETNDDVSTHASNKPSANASHEASAEANAEAATFPATDEAPSAGSESWHGRASLRFSRGDDGLSRHQGGATAPLQIQRAFARANGRCELPLLHTAGGLVGGDRLSITVHLEPGSRALLTSVAAQKVYGSIGRSRLRPEGAWAVQELAFQLQ